MSEVIYTESYLAHHGIKGQKWGVRRYQNEDGSLTAAGKKRYGADLDVNDRSLSNIAKIRTGEAKRKLDVAKSNYNGTNHTRIAELQGRVRSAKRNERYAKTIEKGAQKSAKGETITGNYGKVFAAALGASVASAVLQKHLNARLSDLASQGRYTQAHKAVAQMFVNAPTIASTAYALKKYSDNQKIRTYNRAVLTGKATKKSIGSSEYQDVLNRNRGSKPMDEKVPDPIKRKLDTSDPYSVRNQIKKMNKRGNI